MATVMNGGALFIVRARDAEKYGIRDFINFVQGEHRLCLERYHAGYYLISGELTAGSDALYHQFPSLWAFADIGCPVVEVFPNSSDKGPRRMMGTVDTGMEWLDEWVAEREGAA